MKMLLDRIASHAVERPAAPALKDELITLSYGALHKEMERLSGLMLGEKVGLLLGNGVHWACLDLMLIQTHSVCIPMPGFFSDHQLAHLIGDAGLNTVVTDDPERMEVLLGVKASSMLEVADRAVWLFECKPDENGDCAPRLPAGTIKLTYTSGTTGQPKGVCLSAQTMRWVIASLCNAVDANAGDRALSLLPLSTLLENIAGLYLPLWVGALAQVPELARCGFSGSSGLQPALMFQALEEFLPTTTVLVPQLLKAIVESLATGMEIPASLRFVAVGGAPTPASLITRAREAGLPVYQGYGLSEAASVVSLNTHSEQRDGSVGKPLPHVELTIAEDGEVVVSGNVFLGYLGNAAVPAGDAWHTGDLGYLDDDGFLYLTGRKKTAYATAYGRNVSPEWVESELTGHPLIAQAAVFGEGQSINVAVLVPRPNCSPQSLCDSLCTINERLPDYAQVRRWIIADQVFSHLNGQANSSGCIRRDVIKHHYQARIEKLFLTQENHIVL